MCIRTASLAAVLLSLLAAETARAQDVAACNFQGRFKRIVTASVGSARLARASYAAMIVRSDGAVLCADEVNPDLAMTPASTIKVLVAVAALRRVDRGEAALATPVAINQPNAAQDCKDSSCAVYGPGRRVTVLRLLTDMIVASNNVATNQLIDLAQKPFIAETAQMLGAASLVVNRKLYSRQPAEPNNPTPNVGTARGLAAVYRELASGRLGVLKPASRALLVSLLGKTAFRDRLNGNFPANVPFFHKIGNTSTVSGDAGFYWLGPKTAVVIAGIQSFLDYAPLKRVGRQTLDLTRVMAAPPRR